MRLVWIAARFCGGAVLTLALAYALSEAVDPVYPETRAKLALFRERSAEIQAVSVGNSHTRALDFAALGVEGMHLYEGGQDLFEAAYLADYAVARAPRVKYVLLAASYGLERLDHAAITSTDQLGLRRRIYARTATPRFIEGDGALWLASVFSPIARRDHWAGVALRVVGRDPPREPVRLTGDGRIVEPTPRPFVPDPLARNAPPRPSPQDEAMVNDPTTPARAVARLERLADDLRARGILLVLYTPPYHETVPRFVVQRAPGTRTALAPLLEHPNVVWLDFGEDPSFARRDDLFRDSDHLNPAGARAFSSLLRRCLAALPAPTGCRRVLPPASAGAGIPPSTP